MSNILSEHIAFVKDQISFHKERSIMFSNNNFRKQKHIETAGRFSSLLNYLVITHNKAPIQTENRLFLTPDDLDGLPPELIEELSISDADKAEFKILEFLETHGGVMSLDQILVANFKDTGEIVKRPAMTNRLYRMSNKGLIESVPSKKGVYALKNVQEELPLEDN